MTRRFFVLIELDDSGGGTLPQDEDVMAALSHSTASEALREATDGCMVEMSLRDPEDIARDYT